MELRKREVRAMKNKEIEADLIIKMREREIPSTANPAYIKPDLGADVGGIVSSLKISCIRSTSSKAKDNKTSVLTMLQAVNKNVPSYRRNSRGLFAFGLFHTHT